LAVIYFYVMKKKILTEFIELVEFILTFLPHTTIILPRYIMYMIICQMKVIAYPFRFVNGMLHFNDDNAFKSLSIYSHCSSVL
jgi:hypothetical protein